MKHYCITGGIGSGKSYVCNLLRKHGIEIYDCDSAAKRLMRQSPDIRSRLTALIGPDTYYADGSLNKAAVATFLLASEANKQSINAIVHPAVIIDFYASGMQWMESAILYEAGLEQHVDFVVAVTAPREVRIERIMQRDGISSQKAAKWIDKQTSQEIVAQRADFVITNDGVAPLDEQIEELLSTLNFKL
jgi:dephospho-CoA kinase